MSRNSCHQLLVGNSDQFDQGPIVIATDAVTAKINETEFIVTKTIRITQQRKKGKSKEKGLRTVTQQKVTALQPSSNRKWRNNLSYYLYSARAVAMTSCRTG